MLTQTRSSKGCSCGCGCGCEGICLNYRYVYMLKAGASSSQSKTEPNYDQSESAGSYWLVTAMRRILCCDAVGTNRSDADVMVMQFFRRGLGRTAPNFFQPILIGSRLGRNKCKQENADEMAVQGTACSLIFWLLLLGWTGGDGLVGRSS